MLKDYFNYQGNVQITGARDAIREAFKYELISEGEIWMQMVTDRNLTTHTYDEALAYKIRLFIRQNYFQQFESLAALLNTKAQNA